jgi:hypothetical protein
MGVFETIGRQFDDEPGGGFVEWSNRDRDRYDRDTNGPEEFGDGSNRWIPGTIETIQGEGKQDVSGVLDAAALNFDEGVGGLVSLVDSEPGNTAGPGQSPIIEGPQEGQPGNPGTTGVAWLDQLFKLALAAGGLWVVVNIVAPLLDITAGLIGDE